MTMLNELWRWLRNPITNRFALVLVVLLVVDVAWNIYMIYHGITVIVSDVR